MSVREDVPQYRARVVRTSEITPCLVRVTVGQITPEPGQPPLRDAGPADSFFGLWVPVTEGESAKRYYTVRAWREQAGELDIDMVLHGSGPATEWAARAAVGDGVAFDAPRGHYRPFAGMQWLALCGDATALPAIGRILEERAEDSASAPAHVVVAVDGPAERQQLPLRDGDRLEWVRGDELVSRSQELCRRSGDGYVWFAAEAAQMRAVRHTLRRELQRPPECWMTMGYWRRNSERWLERLAAANPAVHDELERIWSGDGDDEDRTDRAELLLEREGLL